MIMCYIRRHISKKEEVNVICSCISIIPEIFNILSLEFIIKSKIYINHTLPLKEPNCLCQRLKITDR